LTGRRTLLGAVGDIDQKKVMLDMRKASEYRTMEPGILQTCKQIFHEAKAILYSHNVFTINEPKVIFRSIMQIGNENIKLVKTVHIWVPKMAKLDPWLQLLKILAEDASGLRCIELALDANTGLGRYRSLGYNKVFLCALGKIRGLDKLVFKGHYAKHWPAYLEKRMGVRVLTLCGHGREEPELGEGDLN
jgi:hypothetical protein